MLNKIRNLFKIRLKKDNEIELLDDETKFEKITRHLKKKIRRCNKLKLVSFTLSLIIIFLFILSLFTGKNIVLVGVKKVLNGVGIYTEEISNVDITSNNYDDEGSWKINKSAKWTSSTTAEVAFDVNSIRKTNDTKRNIILVIDISESMAGDKINKVISDTKELIDYVLSENNDNKVALITFDTTSTILSDFTNDKDELIEKLNTIEVKGATNYNEALKNVDTIMDGLDKEKDVVTLFLTDGYPNYDTPNQNGTYEILKDKYPYMSIRGVQYEMGSSIINEIKAISDEQLAADQSTLNNVLFEAAVSPLRYEKFIIDDYIGEDFKVNSVDDVEVSIGEVELTEENGIQKITWNLGNNKYVTGSSAKMTIKLNLKQEQKEEVLLPTNKKESITYKIEDENENIVNSNDTPVLKNIYNVIYDTNAPPGCKLDKIDSEKYGIFKTVKKKTDELTCEGYLFKGWKINDEDSIDIKSLGSDHFIMPGHDVTIRATWTKQSITKAMDGKVHEKTTLYRVFENEAKTGTYAKEYTGEHQDSMNKSKSNQKIYYWYADDDANANTILSKNNVIFANHCWQMIRTTDAGGVKLIYNGETEDGKCLTTRGTHVGYSGKTTKKLNESYYYGTSYTYDSTNKSFSLSGTITTGSIETEKYTCLSISEKGTCTELYYVESLSTGTTYNVLQLNTSSKYSIFGELPFSENASSPADVGYMYNTRYQDRTHGLTSSRIIFNYGGTFQSSYWFADSVTYDDSTKMYSLNNPYQISSLSDDISLVGKYTFLKKDSSEQSSFVYCIGSSSGTSMNMNKLTGGETTLTNTYTYGDNYTDNGDGTYTINNPTVINEIDSYGKYNDMKKKYVCMNATNNTCDDLWYITSSSLRDFSYASIKNKFIFGNNFIYANGKYKLVDTKLINALEFIKDESISKNHHYTCYDEIGECTTLSYVYRVNSSGYHSYINLNDGKSIEDALKEMLSADDVNKNESIIKKGIDAWFETTLIDYSDYLEDTIFCNDRSIYDLKGWNPNGGHASWVTTLSFKNDNKSTDLSCANETDKFSTANSKAKLKYKVGLMSSPEIYLMNRSILRKTGQRYWLISPHSFTWYGSYSRYVDFSGDILSNNITLSYGVRPAISLIPGIEYSSGDGSMENPYVIDTE